VLRSVWRLDSRGNAPYLDIADFQGLPIMNSARVESLENYVRVGEAASIFGVTTKTLRNWDRTGKLQARRHPVNGYRIYLREELEALLNRSNSQILDENSG
jgi:hypothetical protein